MARETASCSICRRQLPRAALRPLGAVSSGVAGRLLTANPDLHDDSLLCRDDVAKARRLYLEDLLETERGELGRLDKEVLTTLEAGGTLSENIEESFDDTRKFGEKAADAVAGFGGSWTFILFFCAVLVVWMALNVTGLIFKSFDPFPFILLNLLLSCIAALQAPIIMMSQRRQETKDRLRAENDYKVNLKAELEIRHLHEKLDVQMARQWERLAAIQKIQIELLEEASRDTRR